VGGRRTKKKKLAEMGSSEEDEEGVRRKEGKEESGDWVLVLGRGRGGVKRGDRARVWVIEGERQEDVNKSEEVV